MKMAIEHRFSDTRLVEISRKIYHCFYKFEHLST
jgi:hypothetical protein